MRVVVDTEQCEGNAKCMRICPEVFRVDENDKLHILVEQPDEALRQRVQLAVGRCPRQALRLLEE